MSCLHSVYRPLLTAIFLFVIGSSGAHAADALLQVIHASAWPRAQQVDIYLDAVKTPEFDNLEFRAATPYLEIPAGRVLTLDITPSNTSSNGEEVFKTVAIGPFEAGKRYVAILCGVDGDNWPSGAPGRDIGLNVVTSEFTLEASSPETVELRLFNGLTDAPPLNVYPDFFFRAYPMAEGLDYGVISPAWQAHQGLLQGGVYPVGADEHEFPTLIFQCSLDGAFVGKVSLALITGFMERLDQPCVPPTPFDSQLLIVLEDGSTIDTRLPDSVEEPAREIEADGVRVFPLPLRSDGRIEFELNTAAFVQLELVDQRGVCTVLSGSRFYAAGKQSIEFAAARLTPGTYGLRLRTLSGVRNAMIQVVK